MRQYLIRNRFLVEWNGVGPWLIKDRDGELGKIFGEDTIKLWGIRVYKGDDVYWILDGVKLETPWVSSEEAKGKAVIKGNKVVSYILLDGANFYINHYGQEFFGRVKVGKEKDILMFENYLEVRNGKNDDLYLRYRFLGDKTTPMISVIGERSKVVCFPEFSKVYSGREVHVEECWGCVNVWVLRDNMLSLYMLSRDGKEYLGYEGEIKDFEGFKKYLPTLHRLGDIVVVYFNEEGTEIVKNLRRIPGVNYMYVKEKPKEGVYKKLGQMDKSIFTFQEYPSLVALEKFAKPLSVHQERSLSFDRLTP